MSNEEMTRVKTVLIAGAGTFGHWNTGDEAILAAMVRDMRESMPDLRFMLVSANPPATMLQYGVEEIPIQDIPKIVGAARESDLMVLGGGGLFYDYWGVDMGALLTRDHGGLAFYVGFGLLAGLLNKPLMIYAAGVGPLLSDTGKSLTHAVFDQAEVSTVRDRESQHVLESLGLDVERIKVTADPAFGLPAADRIRGREVLQAQYGQAPVGPVLGVALRNWDIGVIPEQWEEEVATALDAFLDEHGGAALFLPFHRSGAGHLTDDTAVCERVRTRLRSLERTVLLAADHSIEEKAGILASCDVVLGMRLHSVIFAGQAGVAPVALIYDPKVSSVLEQFDCQEYGIEIGSLTAGKLTRLLMTAYENRGRLRESLRARSEHFGRLSRENTTLATALIMDRGSLQVDLAPRMRDVARMLEVSQAIRVYELQQATGVLRTQVADQEAAVQTLQANAAEREENVQTLTAQIAEREETAQALQAQVMERQQAVQALTVQAAQWEQAVQALRTQLAAITSSSGWKLLQALWRIRLLLAPRHSTREWLSRLAARRLRPLSSFPVRSFRTLLRRLPWIRGPLRQAYQRGHAPPVQELAMNVAIARGTSVALNDGTSVSAGTMRGAHKSRIAYLTNQLLDWRTLEPRFGGGERYCVTLGGLLRKEGFDVTFYQAAFTPFERQYFDFKVVGLPLSESLSEFQYGICNAFYDTSSSFDYQIYNLPEYASGQIREGALLICHGIWFDHNNYGPPIAFRTQEWFEHLYRAFSRPRKIVSVDTNTINVIRALWPELASRMTYIPNWVDTELFTPPVPRNGDSVTVLFPRRSQVNRGSRLLRAILKSVPYECRFLWVGEGDAEDTELIKRLAKRDPRLEFYSATFDEMPGFYRRADICVIPSVACEGTSLACLEALASGCAVIATNVGGLSDLVQSGYNGILVDPEPEQIAGAVNQLIQDPHERTQLQRTAVQAAENFGLAIWERRWTNLLNQLGWLNSQRDMHRAVSDVQS